MALSFLLMSIIAPLMTLADSGSGTTTRYWDCCKPSCAWNNLQELGIQSSVQTCDVNDQPLSTNTDQSGCAGGTAYMCSSQSPWAVSDNLAYGFTAVSSASAACCQCYQLTFTSGPATGKQMIVQATNTGTDVGSTQFDLAMPGGGFGLFDGCSTEWGATGGLWGAQYGGMSTDSCSQMPAALQPGCNFRWGSFFAGSDNPTVNWETVACPIELTQKSGCVRVGDSPTSGGGVASSSSAAASSSIAASSSTAAASSSSSTSRSTSTISTIITSTVSGSISTSSSSSLVVQSTSTSAPIVSNTSQTRPSPIPTRSTLLTVHAPSRIASSAAATSSATQPTSSDGSDEPGECDL